MPSFALTKATGIQVLDCSSSDAKWVKIGSGPRVSDWMRLSPPPPARKSVLRPPSRLAGHARACSVMGWFIRSCGENPWMLTPHGPRTIL